LSAEECGRLRGQALSWLRSDLAAWRDVLEKDPGKARPMLVLKMRYWRADSELAGIRDSEGLARLPEAEQQTWRQFWGEVQQLLDQAKATPPTAPPQKP
jgi:hypothetical protein